MKVNSKIFPREDTVDKSEGIILTTKVGHAVVLDSKSIK